MRPLFGKEVDSCWPGSALGRGVGRGEEIEETDCIASPWDHQLASCAVEMRLL